MSETNKCRTSMVPHSEMPSESEVQYAAYVQRLLLEEAASRPKPKPVKLLTPEQEAARRDRRIAEQERMHEELHAVRQWLREDIPPPRNIRKRSAKRRYREAHREEINARRRQRRAQKRAAEAPGRALKHQQQVMARIERKIERSNARAKAAAERKAARHAATHLPPSERTIAAYRARQNAYASDGARVVAPANG